MVVEIVGEWGRAGSAFLPALPPALTSDPVGIVIMLGIGSSIAAALVGVFYEWWSRG